MRVIAIDPGYDRCGVAVLEKKSASPVYVTSLCIETNPKEKIHARIGSIVNALEEIFLSLSPDECALETLFFSKNQKTALAVSEARGAIMNLACRHNLPLYEYTPNTVKIAVTGFGGADKKQIATMIPKLLSLPLGNIKRDDEYDALAIALTHCATQR